MQFELINKRKSVLFLCLTVAVFSLVHGNRVIEPLLWSEDGRIFLGQAVNTPFMQSLFFPYAGYFHVIPRLVAEFTVLFDVLYWPYVMATLTFLIVIALLILSFFSYENFSLFVLSSALFTFCFSSPEIYLNITNIQWFFSIYFIFYFFSNKNKKILNGILFILYALSSPIAGVLLLSRLICSNFFVDKIKAVFRIEAKKNEFNLTEKLLIVLLSIIFFASTLEATGIFSEYINYFFGLIKSLLIGFGFGNIFLGIGLILSIYFWSAYRGNTKVLLYTYLSFIFVFSLVTFKFVNMGQVIPKEFGSLASGRYFSIPLAVTMLVIAHNSSKSIYRFKYLIMAILYLSYGFFTGTHSENHNWYANFWKTDVESYKNCERKTIITVSSKNRPYWHHWMIDMPVLDKCRMIELDSNRTQIIGSKSDIFDAGAIPLYEKVVLNINRNVKEVNVEVQKNDAYQLTVELDNGQTQTVTHHAKSGQTMDDLFLHFDDWVYVKSASIIAKEGDGHYFIGAFLAK